MEEVHEIGKEQVRWLILRGELTLCNAAAPSKASFTSALLKGIYERR